MRPTFMIIGDDVEKTNSIFENIISSKKIEKEQEHIKLDLIINTNLKNDINDIINIIEAYKDEYLVLLTKDEEIYKEFKKSNYNIINKIKEEEKSIVEKIIKLDGEKI